MSIENLPFDVLTAAGVAIAAVSVVTGSVLTWIHMNAQVREAEALVSIYIRQDRAYLHSLGEAEPPRALAGDWRARIGTAGRRGADTARALLSSRGQIDDRTRRALSAHAAKVIGGQSWPTVDVVDAPDLSRSLTDSHVGDDHDEPPTPATGAETTPAASASTLTARAVNAGGRLVAIAHGLVRTVVRFAGRLVGAALAVRHHKAPIGRHRAGEVGIA